MCQQLTALGDNVKPLHAAGLCIQGLHHSQIAAFQQQAKQSSCKAATPLATHSKPIEDQGIYVGVAHVHANWSSALQLPSQL
jgi:hypothetical protein